MTVTKARSPSFPPGTATRPREGPRAYLALLERQAAHVFRGSARGLHAAHVSGGAGLGVFRTVLLLTAVMKVGVAEPFVELCSR